MTESSSETTAKEASVPSVRDDDAVTNLLTSAVELRQRLHAFVCAVAEMTDCGPDVEAIKRADAAIARVRGAA